MGKEPTHSDLLKELVELKKRVEKLEPKNEFDKYRDLLDEIKKAMPEKEYVPYPWYPQPWYPDWPWRPTYFTYTSGTTNDSTDYSNIKIY